jgi:hypothetical protein
MIALKAMKSIISTSSIGTFKKVAKSFHYLVELSKTARVAGLLLTGHTGHLMLQSTPACSFLLIARFMQTLMKN